jgi:hypothetical protein
MKNMENMKKRSWKFHKNIMKSHGIPPYFSGGNPVKMSEI